VKNKKIAMVTFPCVFGKTHGKLTKTNSQNSAFAVRLVPFIVVRFSGRRTTKSHVCRAFFREVHGKQPMFAVRFAPGARQRVSHAVWCRCR
jgi:hypothetical protein